MQRSRIKNLKSKVSNNTKVIENYFFMTALQVINSFFGILIYPYLIRVLGAGSYGMYVFALSVTNYLGLFISFGFAFPALKLIVEHKDNRQIKNEVASAVFTSKLILASVSFLILLLLIFLIPSFYKNKLLLIIVFSQVISTVIYPVWYFQGIQKMKIITYIQLTLRILSLPFTFILIKNSNDILKYAIIVSTTNTMSAIIALIYLYKKELIRYHFIPLSILKNYFKDALPFFWSSSAGTIKEESVNIIIGLFFGMKELAFFNLAEKIIIIPRMLTMSINDALFPKIIVNNDKKSIKKIIKLEFIIGVIVFIFIAIFGKWIVFLLGGSGMLNAYPMAVILSITVLVWLLVGSYISFIFVPAKKYYFVTKNQLVALISFFIFCVPGLLIYKNILVIVFSLSISGICEIVYCNYLIKKNNLL